MRLKRPGNRRDIGIPSHFFIEYQYSRAAATDSRKSSIFVGSCVPVYHVFAQFRRKKRSRTTYPPVTLLFLSISRHSHAIYSGHCPQFPGPRAVSALPEIARTYAANCIFSAFNRRRTIWPGAKNPRKISIERNLQGCLADKFRWTL